MKFTDFKLGTKIQKALSAAGYSVPTEVQLKAIPAVLKGEDLVVRSQTGSGKTMAYALPLIENINFADTNVQVLVVCPTRELALQVADEMQKITVAVEAIRLVTVYGGSDISRQIKSLKRKPQIVVGTPGRIMDHMNRRTLKLNGLKAIVLDEADEMLNMGFKEDVETILKDTPKTRQTLMFSATFPDSIRQITKNYQNKPVSIEVGKENRSLENIKQYYAFVDRKTKKEAFLKLFAQMKPKNSIVFANTKKMTDDLANLLHNNGYASRALHGDLRQSQRKRVMSDIKQGRANILVASDVAARGIDINDIDFVFNYDIPHNVEYFLHRIGRTARAGKTGNAVTVITTRDQLKTLREFEKETNSVMSELKVEVTGGSTSGKKRVSRDNSANSFKARKEESAVSEYKRSDSEFKKKSDSNTRYKNREFNDSQTSEFNGGRNTSKKVNIFSTFENFVDNDDAEFYGDNSDSYDHIASRPAGDKGARRGSKTGFGKSDAARGRGFAGKPRTTESRGTGERGYRSESRGPREASDRGFRTEGRVSRDTAERGYRSEGGRNFRSDRNTSDRGFRSERGASESRGFRSDRETSDRGFRTEGGRGFRSESRGPRETSDRGFRSESRGGRTSDGRARTGAVRGGSADAPKRTGKNKREPRVYTTEAGLRDGDGRRKFDRDSRTSSESKRQKPEFNYSDRKSGRDFETKSLGKSRIAYGRSEFGKAKKGGQRKAGRK